MAVFDDEVVGQFIKGSMDVGGGVAEFVEELAAAWRRRHAQPRKVVARLGVSEMPAHPAQRGPRRPRWQVTIWINPFELCRRAVLEECDGRGTDTPQDLVGPHALSRDGGLAVPFERSLVALDSVDDGEITDASNRSLEGIERAGLIDALATHAPPREIERPRLNGVVDVTSNAGLHVHVHAISVSPCPAGQTLVDDVAATVPTLANAQESPGDNIEMARRTTPTRPDLMTWLGVDGPGKPDPEPPAYPRIASEYRAGPCPGTPVVGCAGSTAGPWR